MVSFPLQIYFIVYFHDGKNNILRYIEYKTPSSMNFWHKLWDVHTFPYEKFSLCSLDNWKRSHTMSMCLCLPAGMPEPSHRRPVPCCRPKPQRRTLNCPKKKTLTKQTWDFTKEKFRVLFHQINPYDQRLTKKHRQKSRWKLKWYPPEVKHSPWKVTFSIGK